MLSELDRLHWSVIQFGLEARSFIDLEGLPASVIRSALGASLRRMVCITRLPDCTDCSFRWTCTYGYLFETPPSPEGPHLRKLQHVPRPYVVRRPGLHERQFTPGMMLTVEVLLIGRARLYLPYLTLALLQLEERGLGRGRRAGNGRFRLTSVQALQPDGTCCPVYDAARRQIQTEIPVWKFSDLTADELLFSNSRLLLRTITPLRLKADRRLARRFTFRVLIRSILSRLSSLATFHVDTTLSLDYRGLLRQAEAVRICEDRMQWLDGPTRYSSRQRTRLRQGGLVGEVILEDVSPELRALLRLGAELHVGHSTVMGLGRYTIAPLSE